MFGGKVDDALAIKESKRIRHHQDGIRHLAAHRRKGVIEIVRLPHAAAVGLTTAMSRAAFAEASYRSDIPKSSLVPQHRHAAKLRQQRLPARMPFGRERGCVIQKIPVTLPPGRERPSTRPVQRAGRPSRTQSTVGTPEALAATAAG